MEAPSMLAFACKQTFFGFKPEDRVTFHENIFNFIWYSEGKFSWDDVYNMPIFLRNFYTKKINKIFSQQQQDAEEQMKKRMQPKANPLPRKPR